MFFLSVPPGMETTDSPPLMKGRCRMNSHHVPIAFILSLLLWSNAATRDKNVTLKWLPSDDVHEKAFVNVKALAELKVRIPPVIDNRTNKDCIGRNIESSRYKRYVTDTDIAQWATGHVRKILAHFKVTSYEKDADLSLQFSLVNFFVTEESIYKGNVSFMVTAKGSNGTVIWKGVVQGDSNRWGRSFSVNNYLECICNAFVDAVYALVANREFIAAVATWSEPPKNENQEPAPAEPSLEQ